MKKKLLLPLAFALLASSSNAATIFFDLVGVAGAGLLPGSEPGSITGGTGGEIGAGISYDDVSNVLTLNVGWGSSQGFINLSSLANNSHIHGACSQRQRQWIHGDGRGLGQPDSFQRCNHRWNCF